jgi:predicted transcriptional regulator
LGEFAAFKSTNATEYGKLTAAQQQVTESARAALQGFVAATTADITAARIAEIKQKLGDIDGLISSVRLSINGLRDVTQRPSMTAQQLEALRVQTLAKIDMILGVLNSQKVKDDTDLVKNPKNTEAAKMVTDIKTDLTTTKEELTTKFGIPADYDTTNYNATQRATLRNQILLTASEVDALERAAKLYLYKLLGQNDSYERLYRMSADDYERTFFGNTQNKTGATQPAPTDATKQAQAGMPNMIPPAVPIQSLEQPPPTDLTKNIADSTVVMRQVDTLVETIKYRTTLLMMGEQGPPPTASQQTDLKVYSDNLKLLLDGLEPIFQRFTGNMQEQQIFITDLNQFKSVYGTGAAMGAYPSLVPQITEYNRSVRMLLEAKKRTPAPAPAELAQFVTEYTTAKNVLSNAIAPYQTSSNRYIKAMTELYRVDINIPREGFSNYSRTFENFQSMGNPYNQASPSAQQMYEFRLGKRMLVNQIGAYAQ